jgi:myosin V
MCNEYNYLKPIRVLSFFASSFQEAIFRTLAAILHLGNIEFSPGKDYDSSVIKDSKSDFHLKMAAELFM